MNSGSEVEKKKILFVIGTLAVGGGAEKVATTIGNELLKKGHDVHMLTFYEAPEKYEFNGIYHTLNESLKHHRLFKIFGVPRRIWKIARFIKQNDFDVAISFLEEANIYSLAAKKVFGLKLPVIVSVRNNTRSRKWLFQKAMSTLYPSAEKVVTVTKAIEEMMREDFALNNLTTIYNPIDIAVIEERLRESLPEEDKWLAKEKDLYVHIGRHTKQKGQWHLLRVFSEYVKENPEAKLLMIGDGELTSQIEKFITENNLTKNIFLLGKRTNVFPYLKISNALLQTSLWEGMPNVLLEALASKTLIVATDCQTGPREIIAPELPLGLDVVYSYETHFGFLTAPLTETIGWQSVSVKPLDKAENQLKTALSELSQKSTASETYDHRIKSFSLQQIVSQWERCL